MHSSDDGVALLDLCIILNWFQGNNPDVGWVELLTNNQNKNILWTYKFHRKMSIRIFGKILPFILPLELLTKIYDIEMTVGLHFT